MEKKTKRKISIRARVFRKFRKYPNLLIIYKTLGMIMVWVGIWGMLEEYIFPESPFLRYMSVLLCGLILLYIDDKSLDELATMTPPKHKANEYEEGLINEMKRKYMEEEEGE